MNLNQIAGVLFAVAIISCPAKGLEINMMEEKPENDVSDKLSFAVNIDDLNYTVVIDDGIVQKIELNSIEEPEFVINTEWDTVMTFIHEYNDMDWLEKTNFMINKFHVPMGYMFDLSAMGVTG